MITFPLHLISELVTMVMAYPTDTHQYNFLSGLSGANRHPAHCCVKPNTPNQTPRHGFDLLGLSNRKATSQLLSGCCVFKDISAVLFRGDICPQSGTFGSKFTVIKGD